MNAPPNGAASHFWLPKSSEANRPNFIRRPSGSRQQRFDRFQSPGPTSTRRAAMVANPSLRLPATRSHTFPHCFAPRRSFRGSSPEKHLDAAVLLPTELSFVAGNRKHLPESFHLYVFGVALGAERHQLATHGVGPLPGQFKIVAQAADIVGKAGQQHLGLRRLFLQIARKTLDILSR